MTTKSELERDLKAANRRVTMIRRDFATLNVIEGLSGGGAQRQHLAAELQIALSNVKRIEKQISAMTTDADRWRYLESIGGPSRATVRARNAGPVYRTATATQPARKVPSYICKVVTPEYS
jgi:hypothetical protein